MKVKQYKCDKKVNYFHGGLLFSKQHLHSFMKQCIAPAATGQPIKRPSNQQNQFRSELLPCNCEYSKGA
jgi:hypothetical protein